MVNTLDTQKRISNFKQQLYYVNKFRGISYENLCNIVNAVKGREISGFLPKRRGIIPRFYERIQELAVKTQPRKYENTHIGCLMFDHSGNYIITGSCNMAVRLWSTYSGDLLHTFQEGISVHSCKVTCRYDVKALFGAKIINTSCSCFIAINPENTLIAADCCIGEINVWNLFEGDKIATLREQVSWPASFHFSSTLYWDKRHLIAVTAYGTIIYWKMTLNSETNHLDTRVIAVLINQVTTNHIIHICSFSPDSKYFATIADDNYIRIYEAGHNAPLNVIEIQEAHPIECFQWAHLGMKFLYGNYDSAHIYLIDFLKRQWRSVLLSLASKLRKGVVQEFGRRNNQTVTAVCWNSTDEWVIVAVNGCIKVYDPNTGRLIRIFDVHTEPVFVLESHPYFENIILTAGYDGYIAILDLQKGDCVCQFLNINDAETYDPIFVSKWRSDGYLAIASDMQGHLLRFGLLIQSTNKDAYGVENKHPHIAGHPLKQCLYKAN